MSASAKIMQAELIDINMIDPSPLNRHPTDDDPSIGVLAESIKAQGLLSPIAIRPLEGGRYEVIFGERRLAAHRRLGLKAIAAEIMDVDATVAQALRLIENMQRKDLEPLEEALGVKALLELSGGDHSEAAARLGRSETWVRRRNRLNNLSEKWRQVLSNPGHEDYDEHRHIGNSLEKMEELAMLPPEDQDELFGNLRWKHEAGEFRDALAGQLRRLDKAPWDKAFTGASQGKCSGCANRSDQEGDLFAPLAEAAKEEGGKKAKPVFCLNRACWQGKTQDWIISKLHQDADLLPILRRWGARPVDAKRLAKTLGVNRRRPRKRRGLPC